MIEFVARTETGLSRNTNQDRIWASSDAAVCAVLVLNALRKHVGVGGRDALLAAAREAERTLLDEMRRDARLRSTGTTLDLLGFSGNQLAAVHIGDGRIYLLRNGIVKQLSADHTLVAEMVARGEIAESEARSHPRSSVITRAIGGSEWSDLDVVEVDLLKNDVVIACTDGVWRVVDEASIAKQFSTLPLSQAVEKVLELSTSSHDNASLVAARVL
jgi:serine/threonine protein phosphatase PrpC